MSVKNNIKRKAVITGVACKKEVEAKTKNNQRKK